MSALAFRLSKLEATVGLGLSPQEQLNRLAELQSSETLLQVLAWVMACKAGTTPPEVSDDVVALVRRIMALLAAAG